METYGIYFTWNGQVLALPVLPQELVVEADHNHLACTSLGVGPMLVPRIPKQKVITLSSYFPAESDPGGYQYFFRWAMEQGEPLLFIRTPMLTGETGLEVLVTRFDTQERGGEPGDVYYTLELTEYRSDAPGVLSAAADGGAGQLTPGRDVPKGTISVGALCRVTGRWWATSYGEAPYGSSDGATVKVSRVVDGARPCPIHITTTAGGPLGWVKAAQLEVVE